MLRLDSFIFPVGPVEEGLVAIPGHAVYVPPRDDGNLIPGRPRGPYVRVPRFRSTRQEGVLNHPDSARNRWGRLALVGAGASLALIILGGVVRITGSGMGCGDDWPLCNGEVFPPLDLPTMIEYGHRLAALAVSVVVVLLALRAARASHSEGPRIDASVTGTWGRLRRLSQLAVVLLVVQILLGAITVWLELPPASVILHLGTAMALLATLTVAASEALGPRRAIVKDRASAISLWSVLFAFVVVVAGGLVANMDAGLACLGFPACNGSWMPAGGNPLIHIHWGHRLLAYLLVIWCLVLPFVLGRVRPWDPDIRRVSLVALVVAVLQLVIGATMVLTMLNGEFRAAHVGFGALLFVVLVRLAWVARHPATRFAR
jgi:cytochrome c oxidase assembly protein subunit 15